MAANEAADGRRRTEPRKFLFLSPAAIDISIENRFLEFSSTTNRINNSLFNSLFGSLLSYGFPLNGDGRAEHFQKFKRSTAFVGSSFVLLDDCYSSFTQTLTAIFKLAYKTTSPLILALTQVQTMNEDEDYQGDELVGGGIQDNEQLSQEKLVGSIVQPFVGMLFETLEEAWQYYVEYGKRLGFAIRTRSTSRNKRASDEVTGATFVCAREGKPRIRWEEGVYNVQQESFTSENEKGKTAKKKRSTLTVKTGCLAYMRVLNDVFTMKWKVTQFEDVHNNNFVTPSKRAKMRSFKEMPMAAKDLAKAFRREGLPVAKVPAIFGGDHATFDSRDCWNHMAKVRQSSIKVRDAIATLNFFRKKLAESPRFYYAVQYDEEGRAANMFWVDGRSRDAYRHFGDVVTFDTTHSTKLKLQSSLLCQNEKGP